MNITILGSTGSIGESTLDVIEFANQQNAGCFTIEALVAGRNAKRLAEQALSFRPKIAVLHDEDGLGELRELLRGSGIECQAGVRSVIEAASRPVDRVMAAISGTGGLLPTMSAIDAGNDILLANKEVMVCAGPLAKQRAKNSGSRIIPVDSEHNAIFQTLDKSDQVQSITLTASGGPFRLADHSVLKQATVNEALNHPNWSMGAKNSLDSATMMNKGLELIEAVYLFDIPQEQIRVVIHPQSIIHSFVSYSDGSVIAQMGTPDMRTPISYALSWPERTPTRVRALDLVELSRLDFYEPDHRKFPALRLARKAADAGALGTCIFNAANEFAGAAFLSGRCGFLDINRLVEDCLLRALDRQSNEMPHTIQTIDDVLHVTDVINDWVNNKVAG